MSQGIQPATPSFDLLRMDRTIRARVVRTRALHVAAWTGVVAVGLKKGGVIGWLGTGMGLFGLVRELLVWREKRPEWRKASRNGPSFRRFLRSGQTDAVDRASAASFPASDAPSHDRSDGWRKGTKHN
jgi:hypothetical protein